MAKALSYVLGRIYQVSTAVFELAYAERKNKIQERHHGSLSEHTLNTGALERFAKIQTEYEKLISLPF